ncbi:GroES-like protein [Rhypophila sp. PSN 637]
MKLYNTAAWLTAEKASPLTISDAPFPEISALQPDDIIIRAKAVAINPVDWKIQSNGNALFPIPYPAILGADVAGEVIHVGEAVRNKFEVGQRVIAHALGFSHGWGYSSFQKVVVVRGNTAVSVLPGDISFEEGVVLPVSVSTAAAGLFWGATLGLSLDGLKDKSGNKGTVLLWGGSSSVGSSVVQLATAAGYEVVATASEGNFGYVKNLGAVEVVDYHDEDVVDKLIKVLKGRKVVGAYDSIGTDGTVRQTAEVLKALGGGKIASVGAAPEDLGEGVEARRFAAGNIEVQEPEIGRAVWEDYVPRALEDGRLRPLPEQLVVGHGLEDIQKGLDRQKEGVSARKVVITL